MAGAAELASLKRVLDDMRENLRRDDDRLAFLTEAFSLAERLTAPMHQAYPVNHHLRNNRRILWLCLRDDIITLNASRAEQVRNIERLADQLQSELGIPV